MIQIAELAIVMKNASLKLQEIVYFITENNNNEAGVGVFLNEIKETLKRKTTIKVKNKKIEI